MSQLPAIFIEQTRRLMGDERFERYLKSFEEEAPVSIRLNPQKTEKMEVIDGEQVPWCRDGYYLRQRPSFTMDPLLHAGCYYVQEAASMFLDEVLRQTVKTDNRLIVKTLKRQNGQSNNRLIVQTFNRKNEETKNRPTINCLDMCAAPGGKSTLMRSVLPDEWVLYSNEPIRNRASILAENVAKWGYDNHIVTNDYPAAFRKSKQRFDLILCDVPCSGEGMFRKDPATIREWSPQNAEKCWRLQREIVDDAWACLNDGGLLIYSTCTFNTKENEENIRYFLEQYDAKLLKINVKPEWNITGSLLEGFDQPVYRFIPGISRGEGLFLCALRKDTGNMKSERREVAAKSTSPFHPLQTSFLPSSTLRSKGDTQPQSAFQVELTYPQAIAYLRHEALVLPEDTPRGIGTVTFQGLPLGQVKNIGTRANNLYPKEWKIKTTHIPNDYEAILRHT